VQSILVLPTRKSMEEFKPQGRELVSTIEKQFDEAGKVNPKFRADYSRAVQNIRRDIYAALSEKYVATLIRILDNILNDKGVKDNPDRPNMPEFWANPQMSLIRSQVVNYKELVEFGDPLLVERKFGLGKTVAFMTQLGTSSQWNEWAGRSLATSSFLPFVRDLQNYLSTQVLTYNQIVTNKKADLRFEFPVAEYGAQMKVRFTAQPDLRPTKEQQASAAPPTRDVATVTMSKKEGDESVYQYVHNEAREPGVYHFETLHKDKDGVEQPEVTSYAYNIDVLAESDLKRAETQALNPPRSGSEDARKGKIVFASPGDSYEGFKSRDPDASENPWLYLLFLVILIVEQALAVHLSFHLKGSESTAPQAAPARSTGAAAAA
jgi:hypothetical protein